MEAKLRRFAARLTFGDDVLLMPLAALLAASARITRGTSCGHDFDFHLVSWMEVQRSWSQGVLYPHWAQTPNWGAGEPRFIFYPPLTWLLGALLGYAIDWNWLPGTLIFLFLLGAGFSTRALARQFLPGPNATLAGIIATSTPYALFTAYERSAFSELAAAIWIPLLLLYAWRLPHWAPQVSHLRPGSDAPPAQSLFPVPCSLFPAFTAPLALILAATWLTNAPAGVMASYLLAFAALAAAILLRAWWPIVRSTVSTALGLGLAAFYLVPAAWEQRWIAIQQAVDVGMRISDSWLFARHSAPDLELHDQVLRMASSIFVFTAVFALTGFAICLLRRKLSRETRHFWLPLALLIPILFVVQLPISAPLWNLLPKLQFLQFPWRWLVVLGIPFAIFLAAATPLSSRAARRWSALVWTVILATIAVAATLLFVQFCDAEDKPDSQWAIFNASTGVEGTDEYAALGSDNSLVASGLPDGCLVSDPSQTLGESDSPPDAESAPVWFAEQGSCDQTFSAQLWQNEHKTLQIDSDDEGFVILRLRRYPAWRITVDGQPIPDQASPAGGREDGLIAVPVPEGNSTIDVRWTTTPDIWWGRSISLASLLLLFILWQAERRIRKRRLAAVHLSLSQ